MTLSGANASNWSNGTNWIGGSAPSGQAATLTFPALTSSACTSTSPTDTCYISTNDISGFAASGLSIDDGVPYTLGGYGITLGSGGLTAAPSTNDILGSLPHLNLPIALDANQSWSIAGGAENQELDIAGAITGSTDTLGISITNSSLLRLFGDAEVGPVTATGSGAILLNGGSLNGTDGNAVNLNGAGLDAFPGSVGPLASTGSTIEIAGTLSVNGGVTLDSRSQMLFGFTPSAEHSQLTASGIVNLANAQLVVDGGFQCQSLNLGEVDTLITTTGSVTGTFSGLPNGALIPASCYAGGSATLRINYTPKTVTATVISSGSPLNPTTTTLTAEPAMPVTNQTVTLSAIVAAASPTAGGEGYLVFDNNGSPIPGCSSEFITVNTSGSTVTCHTSFAAASSPETLQSVFTPSGTPNTPSDLANSSSALVPLTVGKDSTSMALSRSSPTSMAGASVTYTATITPGHPGVATPSGSVEFFDGRAPVGRCTRQPLAADGSTSTATCTLSPSAAGSNRIAATYLGDANFTGSHGEQKATTCTLKRAGNRIVVPTPQKANGTKHHKNRPGTVHLIARCDQSVTAALKGAITERWRNSKGQPRIKVFDVATVHASLTTGVAKTIELKIPPSLLLAFERRISETAVFVLTVMSSNGTERVSYTENLWTRVKRGTRLPSRQRPRV